MPAGIGCSRLRVNGGEMPDDLILRLAALPPAKRALLEAELSSESLDGPALVARGLAAAGVTHLYGVPGEPVYDVFAACAAGGLRLIGARSQQGAVVMAASHNYFAGRQAAAVLVSSGAAACNAVGGALHAQDNCWPLVILAGATPRGTGGQGEFMHVDTPRVFEPVTKWAVSVESTERLVPALAEAFDRAMEGRPGPVLVELPADVLSGRAPAPAGLPTRATFTREVPATQLDEAARRLLAAQRPLVVIGKGLRWANAFEELAELVERLSLPFVTSPIARGYIADDHPLCCNLLRWEVQRKADLVLLLGARLDWGFRFGTQIAPEASVIQVDIHAPQLGRNRAAQLPIHGDVGAFLRGLLDRLPRGGEYPWDTERFRWEDALQERRAQVQRERIKEASRAAPSGRLSPEAFAHRLAELLPRDAVCILDANLVMAACERHIPAYAPLTRLTPGTSGCMGTGIPAGLAAKLQFPEKPVVAVCGDFAFGLSAMEMETAMRHGIALVVVVANNDGNAGSLRQRVGYPPGYAERVTTFQPGIRYERMVEIFGGYAEHVADEASLGPALLRALASGRPACINVAVDPEAPFPRK